MDTVTLLKQGLLFVHLIVFAVAVAEILRGDWRMLRGNGLDTAELERTARIVLISLGGLWATGLALVYIDTGFDPALLAEKPKVVAKLIVVVALTINGALLHAVAFPMLRNGRVATHRGAAVACAMLGAVSTVSWLYASFVGVARLIAGKMGLVDFLALYAVGLVAGIGIAALVVAPMLRQRMAGPPALRPMDEVDVWHADLEAELMAEGAGTLAEPVIPPGRREESDRQVA